MNMASRAYVCIAFFLLCSSSFRFESLAVPLDEGKKDANVASDEAKATTKEATATSSVAPSASSVAPSAEATVNATETTANVTEATEAPTTMAVTTTAPEPKNVTLTMTIKIEGVLKNQCEEVKKAEQPATEAPVIATTAATEPPAKTNATVEATSTVAATSQAATAATAATEAPTEAPTTKGEGRKRRAAEAFNPNTFVTDAKEEFQKLMTSAGAKDASVDVTNIVCGSIEMGLEVNGEVDNVDAFKEDLKEKSKAGLTIQGITVEASELTAAAESVKEKDVTPEVSTGGLSDGAIAGIVIGVVLLLIIIVLVVMALKKGSRQSADLSSTSRVKLSEVQDGR